jgi:hypothetical protein
LDGDGRNDLTARWMAQNGFLAFKPRQLRHASVMLARRQLISGFVQIPTRMSPARRCSITRHLGWTNWGTLERRGDIRDS